jgi:hypothetical protein
MEYPEVVGTKPGWAAQTRKEYSVRSSSWPKTCAGMARSKATTSGSASATTWCDGGRVPLGVPASFGGGGGQHDRAVDCMAVVLFHDWFRTG